MRSKIAWWPVLFYAVVAGASACVETDRSTQITVALGAETAIPSELDTIEVVVVDGSGAEIYRNQYPVTTPRFFPTTLAVVPKNDDSFNAPVTVEVRGYKTGSAAGQVFRRAKVPFFRGHSVLLPMPLRMACFSFVDCKADETCAGGACVPATIDSASLSDYREELVFGGLPNASCFDEAQCLASGVPIAVAADCTFPLPDPTSAPEAREHVNVSIRWAAAKDRLIGLDGADPVEGWARVDDRTGRLSPGVCASLLDPEVDPALRRVPDRALDARLSTACTTKAHAQPYCPGEGGASGIGTRLAP